MPSPWAILICLALGAYVYRRRTAHGAGQLFALVVAIGLWSIAQTIGSLVDSLDASVLAAKLEYPGIAAAPVLWFLFAVVYSGRAERLRGPTHVLLWAVPALTVALTATNGSHGWIWSELELVRRGALTSLAVEHGPYFVFHAVYSYSLILTATGILAWSLAHVGQRRAQFAAVLGAPAVVGAANLYYLSPLYPVGWFDLTAFAFSLAAAVLCLSLLHHGFSDLRPIARHAVVETIADAVFVLDRQGNIADLNPAATAVLGENGGTPIGLPFVELLDAPVLGGSQLEDGGEVRDLPLRRSGEERTYDVRISLLQDQRLEPAGRVLVFRDTTARLQTERGLKETTASLEQANRELERLANTDTLTGLSNRRHFTSTLESELRRALRHNRPLSLIILDLDRFKQVNDQHGHAVGDRVLVRAARAVQEVVRDVDLVGRIGGEEFAVLVPETDLEGAFRLAERIRAGIAANGERDSRGSPLHVTASLGVASLGLAGSDADSLLLAADDALYAAKKNGRNRAERATIQHTPLAE